MIDKQQFRHDLLKSSISALTDILLETVDKKFQSYTHGELSEWENIIRSLPIIQPGEFELKKRVSIGSKDNLINHGINVEELTNTLKKLHPWRKGPFDFFGIHIDTEWRSDWKWNRVLPHISSLKNRTVLDVGCGNGYHCWRIYGEGAKLVLGIDPSQKFLGQFSIFKKYLSDIPVHLLPLTLEDMPDTEMFVSDGLKGFDTVFSMGVLYHRRSPIDHLLALKSQLNKGGELILETLVIDGDETSVLVPEDRYAQMRNVWFIPSVTALERWLRRSGFINIRTVDISRTSYEEQRKTDWMHFHSLEDYLNNEKTLTVEGYQAPTRAILIANKPK
ncbi:MAG: tRNA 5-methoxyuridine(34)/uridine 5-oxyacetic acid(34) synthase CmoB [Gammaproteobacteria bacterium]|nr:tRNA 5-methoxyuridine(34)/uridine 5-oxyacetic acid(34) synthase CmoB [Gammaproteobacteria bacterium]MDH5628578.1 tRNA 5-methoxyuridine(34)/uridine 5-oxyacetic acid(34) synthase CmoB [Gammaproteobacteria bacterium]